MPMSPLSPPPILPWGRLVPSARGVPTMQTPVDFLPKQTEYWLGRSSTKCDVQIQVAKKSSCWSRKEATMMAWAHSMISNKHCRIFQDNNSNNQVFIEDMSGNGTFINQTTCLRKGQQRILHSGDEICLVNPETLRKKISSARVLQNVIDQYTFTFVQSVNTRKPCVNPRAMNYRQRSTTSPSPYQSSLTPNNKSCRRIESLYELREKIGDGTSGQVRRAIHRQTGKEFAVKVISLRRQLDTAQMEEEVRLMQSLDHPYIVQLVDVFVQNGVAMYLVMELVAGGDLFDCIVQQQRYTETDARRAMRRLLSAVYYLHDKCNIVHRDLKPENVLCVSPTHVKLADFGLAKIMKSDGLKTFCGTPQYFAPEVLSRRHTVAGQGRYGKPADMWSLGVILYILLAGKPPFGMVDFMEVGGEQETHEQYALEFDDEHIWETMPMAKDLVEQLLRLDPKRRSNVRQACDHAWINMEDGDTHVHPLDDPAVTGRKRLVFSDVETSNLQKTLAPQESKANIDNGDQPATTPTTATTVTSPTTESNEKEKILTVKDFANAAVTDRTDSFMDVDDSSAPNTNKPPTNLFREAITSQQLLLPNNQKSQNVDDFNQNDSDTTDNVESPPASQTSIISSPPASQTSPMNSPSFVEEKKTDDIEEEMSTSPDTKSVVNSNESTVTPNDGDIVATPHQSPTMNLNQRSNRFRKIVLDQQEERKSPKQQQQQQQEIASPEPVQRKETQVAVTPNASNVTMQQQRKTNTETALEDDVSQFSSDHSSLESFGDSPACSPAKKNTKNDKKRPLEDNQETEQREQQGDAKRRNTRQTTLTNWFIKRKDE